LSFGTAASRLIAVIDNLHEGLAVSASEREPMRLSRHERRIVTTWIDLNCPLWDNYAPELHLAREPYR
jgi:hypothetical protein